MSDPFYQSICANECRNTHHKLVMDSLKHLQREDGESWKKLFVKYFEVFLQGSKDPDKKFRDFRNHVLHVQDNFWGGPVAQAERWYDSTVKRLSEGDFKSAVYCAGVLSHYYMDPLMPLHTGQSEEEGVVHRACEWSINKAFKGLMTELEQGGGYPKVELPVGTEWLKKLIHHNATMANRHYQTFIDHYDIHVGSVRPVDGLDDELREISSALLGYASISFARILEKAIQDSGAKPEGSSGMALRFYYLLTRPVSWGMKWMRHWGGTRRVGKIADEYLKFGKVIDALPVDEQVVRGLHAKEVLKIELEKLDEQEIRPVGTRSPRLLSLNQHAAGDVSAHTKSNLPETPPTPPQQRTPKFRLSINDPLVNAPSIGEKTAARFASVGLKTVGQFLSIEASKIANAIKASHITPEAVKQWQIQANLACRIPGIYGHDAQIMAFCGFDSPEELAASDAETVLSLVQEFEKTKEAQFILRDNKPPDLEEVQRWIEWAKQSRQLKRAA